MLGWQEDVLHARRGGLGLRKTPNLFPGYLPSSKRGSYKGWLHLVGLISCRDADTELETSCWQWGVPCPCRNLPRTVSPCGSGVPSQPRVTGDFSQSDYIPVPPSSWKRNEKWGKSKGKVFPPKPKLSNPNFPESISLGEIVEWEVTDIKIKSFLFHPKHVVAAEDLSWTAEYFKESCEQQVSALRDDGRTRNPF